MSDTSDKKYFNGSASQFLVLHLKNVHATFTRPWRKQENS